MTTDSIKISLETKDGRAIRTHLHEGRTYIESHENVEYRIRVKNKTGKRIKACVSVDGISIVTGKLISDKPDETGYVIGPHAEELFKGYRVDENTVAEFKFVKKASSYATEQGAGQGSGVIAVRAWAEKADDNERLLKLIKDYEGLIKNAPVKEYVPYPVYPAWPHWYDWRYLAHPMPSLWYGDGPTYGGSCSSAGMSLTATVNCGNLNGTLASSEVKCSNTTFAPTDNVTPTACLQAMDVTPFEHGSGWGNAVAEKVTEVAFEVGALLKEVAIYYAPLEGLKSLGVNVTKDKQVVFPEPFKREFAAPPKGWSSGVSR